MSDIKVSVVIPVYNVEKYLPKCLDSLIGQTLKEIEIICINDASTDSSLEVLREYEKKDPRVKIIDKPNEGPSAARNLGIEKASGEYISFVDSDDWVSENFLEALYCAAKKYNSDIACCGFIRHSRKQTKRLGYKKEEFVTDADEKLALTRIPELSYVWNKIYKKEKLCRNNLYFPVGRIFEDICWSIKAVYYLNGVVAVPSCYYFYRKNPSSLVSNLSSENAKDCSASEQEMFNFAQEKNLKLPAGYKFAKRDKIKFLGVPVMKKFYYYPDIVEYCLFGFLPIYKGRIKINIAKENVYDKIKTEE